MKRLFVSLLFLFFSAAGVAAQTEAATLVEKARLFYNDQKFSEAVAEISKAIAFEPGNADLYITRAEYNFLLEKKTDVLNDAQKAVSLAPTDKKILYFSAQILRQSGQYEQALKISDSHIALGDADRFAWGLRVSIKTHLKDFIGAFEDATAAAEIFPQDSIFKQNQANLIRLMGDSDKALEMYNKQIAALETRFNKTKDANEKTQLKRDLISFLFSRSGILFSKLENEQAKSDLIKAIEYEPTESNYFRRAKSYRQQKMYAESVADLNKVVGMNGQFDKAVLFIERGDVLYSMQKYAEAIADYERALKLDETHLKDLMQNRIKLAKQKMEVSNQPK